MPARRSAFVLSLLGAGCVGPEPSATSGTSTSSTGGSPSDASTSAITGSAAESTTMSSVGTSGSGSSSSDSGEPTPTCVALTPPQPLTDEQLAVRVFDAGTVYEADVAAGDLDRFVDDLLTAHSYVQLNAVDLPGLVEPVRSALEPSISSRDLRLQMTQVLTRLGDMHGRMEPEPSGDAFADFLLGDAESCVVAFEPDRSALVDRDHPCVLEIDDAPIDGWLASAERLTTQGSPQMRRRGALRMLREIELLRRLRGMAASNDVVLTLGNTAGGTTVRTNRDVVSDRPIYGDWPLTTTQLGGSDVAYIRIPSMDDELLPELRARLTEFADARAWVVDVRENGGGTRGITELFMAHLVPDASSPWITNVAWYRDVGQGDAALHARGLLSPSDFDGAAKQRVDAFLDAFEPCATFDVEGLTGPYVHAHPREAAEFTFSNPVVVLIDAGCASACDVFASALGTLPTVTLVGEASSGGSGASDGQQLPATSIAYRRSTMISHQRDGNLFDGVGVAADIVAPPSAAYFVGEADPALDAAFATAAARATRAR